MKKILLLMIILAILATVSAAAADTEDHKNDFIYVNGTNIIVDYIARPGYVKYPRAAL